MEKQKKKIRRQEQLVETQKIALSAVTEYRKKQQSRLKFGAPTRALDHEFTREDPELDHELERNRHQATRREDRQGPMPPPRSNAGTPTTVNDPNLAVFNTPVDCVVVAASFFNKMKITGHPGCDTAVKLPAGAHASPAIQRRDTDRGQ